jgi:hypothetical protein
MQKKARRLCLARSGWSSRLLVHWVKGIGQAIPLETAVKEYGKEKQGRKKKRY